MVHPFVGVCYPRLTKPREYVKGIGWVTQDGNRKRIRKPHYHYIWPKDGRNGSKLGRLKDILKGTGPDIHVSISAQKGDYMHNRSRKSIWSVHTNLDDRSPDVSFRTVWLGTRRRNEAYDFKTRKYRSRYGEMWTDATWDQNVRHGYPSAFRDIYGHWYQQSPHAERDWLYQNYGYVGGY